MHQLSVLEVKVERWGEKKGEKKARKGRGEARFIAGCEMRDSAIRSDFAPVDRVACLIY